MGKLSFTALKPRVVLGIAAHPDDLDFGAAGTLAKFARDGAEIYYLLLTDGSKGSADPDMSSARLVKMRQDEQRAATKVIGGKEAYFLNHPDGELEVTLDLKREIVKAIRSVRPDTVVTMDPTMVYSATHGFINHPDHRAAGQAALDAVYPLARDHLTFPDLYAEGYQPHKVKTMLLVNFEKQNYYVDITDTLETKFDAIEAHKSQVADMPAIRQRFMERAAEAGRAAKCAYAEAFVRIDID